MTGLESVTVRDSFAAEAALPGVGLTAVGGRLGRVGPDVTVAGMTVAVGNGVAAGTRVAVDTGASVGGSVASGACVASGGCVTSASGGSVDSGTCVESGSWMAVDEKGLNNAKPASPKITQASNTAPPPIQTQVGMRRLGAGGGA